MAGPGVLFDVDGTLVDNTYVHAVAFARSFADCGRPVPMVEIHRRVGMGATELVHDILGDDVDDDLVDALSDGHSRHIKAFEDDMRPFPKATELLRTLADRGLAVVLATSAKPDEVEHRVSLLAEAEDAITAVTASADAEQAKPAPDIFLAALEAGDVDPERCLVVGDATWDVIAATRAGLGCIGVESGGFSRAELEEAGAVAVYKDTAALLADLDGSPLSRLVG